MSMKRSKEPIVPIAVETWKDAFKSHNVRVGLNLQLSRAMLELLCAFAEDVHWDRSAFGGLHCPDSFIATSRSLVRRGLIREDPRKLATKKNSMVRSMSLWSGSTQYSLTPAGRCVVDLLKSVGLFVDSDHADIRRSILKRG